MLIKSLGFGGISATVLAIGVLVIPSTSPSNVEESKNLFVGVDGSDISSKTSEVKPECSEYVLGGEDFIKCQVHK